MSKHTRGPWTIEEVEEIKALIRAPQAGDELIAVVYTRPDARLIVTLPELLEAAQDVLDCFMEDGETWGDELETPVRESKGFMTRDQKLEKLATVIAKTKGETVEA